MSRLPRELARELIGHDASTVQREGWAGITNGELLRRAGQRGFDALITADQSLPFQQNLAQAQVAAIVVAAPSTKLEDVVTLVPNVLSALRRSRRGRVEHVS
jgi:hypothetical protein